MLAAQNGSPVPQVPSIAGSFVCRLRAVITFQRFVTNQNSESQKRTVFPARNSKSAVGGPKSPEMRAKVDPKRWSSNCTPSIHKRTADAFVERNSALVRLQSAIDVFAVPSVSITEASR
jgi:hypothetical protein